MIARSISTLVFHEPSLDTVAPECLETVAACLWFGFQLVPAPAVNHEDVIIGKEKLGQFRDAKRSSLRREVRWHFQGGTRAVHGVEMGVRQFRLQWQQDAKLSEVTRLDPKFNAYTAGLARKLAEKPRIACMAEEGERTSIAKRGGDKQTAAAMARFHENGV